VHPPSIFPCFWSPRVALCFQWKKWSKDVFCFVLMAIYTSLENISSLSELPFLHQRFPATSSFDRLFSLSKASSRLARLLALTSPSQLVEFGDPWHSDLLRLDLAKWDTCFWEFLTFWLISHRSRLRLALRLT
jgi:hypothetical protein